MAKEEVTLVPVQKKSKLKFLLIAALFPMAGAGGFFGWKMFSATPAPVTEGSEASAEGHDAEAGEAAGSAEHGEPGEKTVQSTVLNFEPFLVNLSDREISRYLRVTIRLQMASRGAAEKIASADVLTSQMRDAILGLLSSRNSEQIITPEGKEQLKTDIAEKLNGFLPNKPVKAVFFTDFVVQL